MSQIRYRFNAPWWGTALVLLLLATMLSLGNWQVQRGHAKNAMIAEMERVAESVPQRLSASANESDLRVLRGARLRIRGDYDPRQILHDNQVENQVPGFHVWNGMRLTADGPLIMINRGWVPAGPSRQQLPTQQVPAGPVEVTGRWRALPEPGMRLGEFQCQPAASPIVVQYPRAADLTCLLSEPVADGILMLDSDQPDGFVRNWHSVGLSPEKHFGYAFQWFALSLALLLLFLFASVRRADG